MIGQSAIMDGRINLGMTPPTVFIHLVNQASYEAMKDKNSGYMTQSVESRGSWFPDVILGENDFVSKCDFGFVNGLTVQADLGDDYARGFKFAMAIVERNPIQLIASMGKDQPLLMWTEFKGFYE